MGVASTYIASTAQVATGVFSQVGARSLIIPIKADVVNAGTWAQEQPTLVVQCIIMEQLTH